VRSRATAGSTLWSEAPKLGCSTHAGLAGAAASARPAHPTASIPLTWHAAPTLFRSDNPTV
jgi:hypothetical protein